MYKLIIENDNYNMKIINNNEEKKMNINEEIFDYVSPKTVNTFMNIYNEYYDLYLRDYHEKAALWFYATFLKVPTYTKEHLIDGTKTNKTIEFTDNIKNCAQVDNYINMQKKDINIYQKLKDTNLNINERVIYNCDNEDDIFLSSIFHFLNIGKVIVQCSLCGKYFIPTNRKDTQYCNRINSNNKTCKDINIYNKQIESGKDILKYEYKKAYNNVRNKYGPKSVQLSDLKNENEKKKKLLVDEKLTEQEYIKWLKSHKNKKD